MLPAISLDDEPTAEVHEIDDKRPQRLLAPELLPHEPVRAQATPQTTLAGAPISGISNINRNQAELLWAMNLRKPASDTQMSLL